MEKKENKKTRKTDRRTLYTINVIKDALLELLEETPFEKLTVAAICRRAEITRATFYLHFENLTRVVDEVLSDAFSAEEYAGKTPNENMETALDDKNFELSDYAKTLPLCQRVASQPKYRALLKDESLAAYIIKSIYVAESEKMLPLLMKECGLTRKRAEKIFLFVVYGAYYVNKSFKWEQNEDWLETQSVLSKFILNGFACLARNDKLPNSIYSDAVKRSAVDKVKSY